MFTVFTNNCDDHFEAPCDPPETGVFTQPSLELTTTDAYADGLVYLRGHGDETRDVRFEATFHTVSEPSTWLLMVTGLIGVGIVARRRREDLQEPGWRRPRATWVVRS
jgi:hypothetical protein